MAENDLLYLFGPQTWSPNHDSPVVHLLIDRGLYYSCFVLSKESRQF